MTKAFHFADQVIVRTRVLGHPLCVGLDPFPDHIPKRFEDATAVATAGTFLEAILDRVAGKIAVVKPQIACFEQYGPPGLELLAKVVAAAHQRDLLVLLDAKRGDIGTTAEAYARAYLDPDSPIACDAITLNPYLGFDTLGPFLARAEAHGRGLLVLIKTSNPGSADVQDQMIDGEPLFQVIARSLATHAEKLRGPTSGWSNLGVVVGATRPEHAPGVRAIVPHSLFLVPGYGVQGASAAATRAGFVPGPNGLEGGLVNSSRAILYPAGATEARDAKSWEQAIDGAIANAIADLRDAPA